MALLRYIAFAAFVLLFSCGGRSEADTECLAASEAAKEYYSFLTESRHGDFVNGFARVSTFPEDYRKAFVSNTDDFMELQKERHGGIIAVETDSAYRDTINKTINVFLTLSYGDSTKTRVIVPMIKNNDKWLMK